MQESNSEFAADCADRKETRGGTKTKIFETRRKGGSGGKPRGLGEILAADERGLRRIGEEQKPTTEPPRHGEKQEEIGG